MRRAAIWGNAVASLAVDPTGRRAALSDARGEMAVLNIGNGAFRALPAVDIHADGRLRAVGEEHGELSFWELASPTELVRVAAHQGPVLALRTSPAATWAIAWLNAQMQKLSFLINMFCGLPC